MSVLWNQPTLGGPSVKSFAIGANFRWPLGWRANVQVVMEGEHDVVELARASELTTEQLQAWLETIMPLVLALMFNDDLPDTDGVA